MKQLFIIACTSFFMAACSSRDAPFDASGTFEAEETIISAEATGVLKEFSVEEGSRLEAGQYIGYIDSTQTYLRRTQLEKQIGALESRKPEITVQLAALQTQLEQARREQQRMQRLVRADAATSKQLDEATDQVRVLERQLSAQRSTLDLTTRSITRDADPLQAQVAQTEDQLSKYRLINPIGGTVLATYAETGEMAQAGKPLYRIADLGTLWLRAYVSAGQLPALQLGQRVTVLIDSGSKGSRRYEGTISWISDKAEFTPKSIQTKEERVNSVYALKVKVKNDGALKIGMYGELQFKEDKR